MSDLFSRSKQEWRKQLKVSLEQFLHQDQGGLKAQAEKLLQKNLVGFLSSRAGNWGGYKALPKEPEIQSAVDELKNLCWVFPRMHGEKLCWYQVGAKGFELGDFSVSEPIVDGAQQVFTKDLQGLIVPGIGFDRSGNRLGHGKGFYDRSLAGFRGLKIGVCFDTQLVESLPSEAHDIKMDWVITEKNVHRPQQK